MTKKKTKPLRKAKIEAPAPIKTRNATEIIKDINTLYPKINISPEMYNAWVKQFANMITNSILDEVVREKQASKKKKA